jgi:hypothetical protein
LLVTGSPPSPSAHAAGAGPGGGGGGASGTACTTLQPSALSTLPLALTPWVTTVVMQPDGPQNDLMSLQGFVVWSAARPAAAAGRRGRVVFKAVRGQLRQDRWAEALLPTSALKLGAVLWGQRPGVPTTRSRPHPQCWRPASRPPVPHGPSRPAPSSLRELHRDPARRQSVPGRASEPAPPSAPGMSTQKSTEFVQVLFSLMAQEVLKVLE